MVCHSRHVPSFSYQTCFKWIPLLNRVDSSHWKFINFQVPATISGALFLMTKPLGVANLRSTSEAMAGTTDAQVFFRMFLHRWRTDSPKKGVYICIPSRKLTYPTWGKGKSSSNMPYQGDMLVPWMRVRIWNTMYTNTWKTARTSWRWEKRPKNSSRIFVLHWKPCLGFFTGHRNALEIPHVCRNGNFQKKKLPKLFGKS